MTIPSDLIAAKCIPPGFMVEKGWNVVSDYYIRQKTGVWVPYSKQLGGLAVAPNIRTSAEQPYGKAKFEVQKKVPFNPIMQDQKKGKLRYYTYGPTFFNYGMLPQTWEDPAKKGFNNTSGDNDPLDVMEIG